MKKFLVLLMAVAMVFCLCACGGGNDAPANTPADNNAPTDVLTVNLAATPSSGQVFYYISEAQGFQAEEGVKVEMTYINNVPDALTALAAGKVNVASTYGTGGPLVNIAQGVDITIFGGYMIIGETPVYGKPETEFTGLESFVGKKLATSMNGTADSALRGILYDAGLYDQVEFVDIKKSQDVLQAIAAGEVDFGATATGHQLQAAALGLEVKMWPDEYWPNHSCCRMIADGQWIKDETNQEALYRMCRAFLRAEEYHQTHKDETVQLVVKNLDLDQATVETFVLSEHMKYDTDPFKNSVIKMWDKFQDIGRVEADDQVLLDHINTEIYERALKSLLEDYPDSQFFKDKWVQYEGNNY